jgi:CheY-like chemotaxis protein
VLAADDGSRGFAIAQRRSPDAIILDLMMPVMDGFRFREAQKQDRTLADIPVVIISAVAAQNAAALGDVAACLAKPFSIDVLLDTISMCQRQESRRDAVAPSGQ